ncbi:MAG: hypothetical protein HRU20_20615 [Pseudomonadales bacterium]|nr:hypothetical protein [Pseudomonadales bacterium]
MKLIISIFFIFTSVVNATEVKKFNITTERGDVIEAQLHTPKNIQGKIPALLIAPGKGYHMDLPLVKKLAQEAAENNIISLIFNWHSFTSNGTSSEDLAKEVQDMAAALKYIKSLANVDTDKIMLAGKSLGSVVAYKIFKSHQDLFSLYLLTPLCTWHWDDQGNQVYPFPIGEIRYPKLNDELRPIHITLGNKDTLCMPEMLYDFLKMSNGNISTTVLGGDHGMNLRKWHDPTYKDRNEANLKAAVHTTSHWMNLHLTK